MSSPPGAASDQPGPQAGLCDSCSFQQVVRNTRGSVFSLCRRGRLEPDRFVRYPPLPVLGCDGYERRSGGADGDVVTAAGPE